MKKLRLPDYKKRNARLDRIAKKLGRTTLNSDLDFRPIYDNAYTDGWMQGHFYEIKPIANWIVDKIKEIPF